MDRRSRNSSRRGQCWRPKSTTAEQSQNSAGGATANSLCDGSKDDVSSYQTRNSQPMSSGEKSNQYGHVNTPKYQYRQICKSPISSGGEDLNLVNDVSRATEAMTPSLETSYYVPVSNPTSDLRDKRFEPWGPGKGHMVDDGEKSNDFLHFESSSTGSSAHHHDSAGGATANSPCEILYGSKDDVFSSQSGYSQPMSLGKKSNQYGHVNTPKSHYRQAAGVNSLHSLPEISSANKDGVSSYRNQTSKARSGGNSSKQFNHMKTFEPQYTQFHNSSGAKDILTGVEKRNLVDKDYLSSKPRDKSLGTWTPHEGQPVDNDAKSRGFWSFETSYTGENTSTLFTNSSLKDKPLEDQTGDNKNSDTRNPQLSGGAYDICPRKSEAVITLKPSLHTQNRTKRAEAKRSMEGQKIIELRSGMILLKQYVSIDNQVGMVKECRNLGIGPGGFYEPGYRDGGKLHLKMMCLGKNWDPQKREYGEKREIDDAKPPLIPNEFHQLVTGAIEASHSFLRERSKSLNVGSVVPSMSPNICIVNFYTKNGQLGLHQDKDESKESLDRKLPVVSVSIGDSAEFVYGDQRDPEKAEKIVLKSGDVLIFGGKSRLIFHGVTSIVSDTAPKLLLEETCLRPGRLNLTFRES